MSQTSSINRAIADLLAKADTSGNAEATLAFRHSALIARNGWSISRQLTQLRQHARFHSGNPDKAAAYREAIAIVTHHTGEDLAPEIVRESYAQADLLLACT